MTGLLVLLALVVWLFACIKLSALAIGSIRSKFTKFLVGLTAFASLLISPIADDILGTRQYKKYCEGADYVKTLGTMPVRSSTGLYEANGEWRLAKLEPSAHDDRSRLTRVADGLVRWDHGSNRRTESIFPIHQQTTKIYAAESERLLAEFTSYHYRGGFLRRTLFDSPSQCFPKEFGGGLYRKLFVFQP